MDYTVGSIADIISGKTTPNKPKVVQKEFKMTKKEVQPNIFKSKKPNSKFSNASAPERKKFKDKIKKSISTSTTPENNTVKKDNQNKDNKSSKDIIPKTKKPTNDFNAEKRIKKKIREESEKLVEDRTIFVGNIPLSVSKITLKRFFSKIGEVDAVRIRGVPVADPKVPKKVALIKKEFHPKRNSAHCFVRFQSSESAQKALKLNGTVYKDHHLRVCFANEKHEPESNAIFIGNLSFNAEEEELWKLFEPCGNVTSVRIVRDPRTGMGKGFGYVNFESKDSVELALQMDSPALNGRQLRVSLCKADKKKKERKATVRPARKEKLRKASEEEGAKKEATEDNEVETKPKKQKKKKEASESGEQKSSSVNYVGMKFTDKKKKKKVNKGLLQKKKLSKLLTSK